jgi:O-antigen biosynthesis protein WbqP
MKKSYLIIKRVLDFLFSFFGIVILMPVFLIIAILIKVDSKGPVFFIQKRVGKNKKHFNILKFRTMKTDAPKDMPTHMFHTSDGFITNIGKLLRKTSFDEMPQIINIFKGDMSFIGPRPALWNQEDLIAERDKYGANDLYPGLSGWAQVNGRDELPIEEKASYDGEYVQRMSFYFDLIVFLKTVFSVIKSEGVIEGNRTKGKKRKNFLEDL